MTNQFSCGRGSKKYQKIDKSNVNKRKRKKILFSLVIPTMVGGGLLLFSVLVLEFKTSLHIIYMMVDGTASP